MSSAGRTETATERRLGPGAAFVLLLCAAAYWLAGQAGVLAHRDPAEMDTTAYLSAARQIRETGGILRHVPNCFSGVYREATQHPLYLLLLSPSARPDVRFFVEAKQITFWTGFFLLAALFAAAWRLLGTETALVAVCLVLGSATFLSLSTMVACETLYGAFFFLFWWFAAAGFERPRCWLAAGVFLGLAFLTKSSAILALPAFVLAAAAAGFAAKKNFFASRCFWGFFALFFLTASPLLVRNVKVYGKPFYSDSTAVLWIDRWRDYYRPEVREHPPTAADYLRTHSPGEIAQVWVEGFRRRTRLMVSDGLKPFVFWRYPVDLKQLAGFHVRTVPWQDAWAAVLVFLALAGLWIERRKPAAILAAAVLAVFVPFVAWYSKVFPGNPPTRLLFPPLFFVPVFAAGAVVAALSALGSKSGGDPKIWTRVAAGAYAATLLASMGGGVDWKASDVRNSYGFQPVFAEQVRWAAARLREDDTLMAGSFFKANSFYFEPRLRGRVVAWPQVSSFEELADFVRKENVRYAIFDLSTAAYDMKVYGAYFRAGPKIGLEKTDGFPAPFRELEGESPAPRMYRVYEIER